MAPIMLHNPNTNLIADHLHCIGRGIDFYSSSMTILYCSWWFEQRGF